MTAAPGGPRADQWPGHRRAREGHEGSTAPSCCDRRRSTTARMVFRERGQQPATPREGAVWRQSRRTQSLFLALVRAH